MTFPIISGEPPEVADFNTSQAQLEDIIGLGENGYGIPTLWSAPVSREDRVRASNWNYLQRDLDSVYIHITNTGSGVTSVLVTGTTVVSSAVGNTIYNALAYVQANRYTCHPSQYYVDPVTSETWNTTDGTSTRTTVWGLGDTTEITHKVNAVWQNRLSARYFFNQGGYYIWKPSHLNDGKNELDTEWARFINWVNAQGGYEYGRTQYMNTTTNTATASWNSGTLTMSVVAERNPAEDAVLFTISYRNNSLPSMVIAPSTGYWNVIV